MGTREAKRGEHPIARRKAGRREKPPNQKSRTHRSALLRSEEWSGRGAATCATDGSALPCPAAADPGGIRSRVFSLMSCACDHSSHSHSLLCSSLRPASALVKAILCALTWLTARRNCSCSSSAHLLPGSAMSVMFSFYASMFQGPPGWAGSCMHACIPIPIPIYYILTTQMLPLTTANGLPDEPEPERETMMRC